MSVFAERRARSKGRMKTDRKGFGYKFQVGTSLVALCQAQPETSMADAPYVEIDVHFGVGLEGKMTVCLNPDQEILRWPEMKAYLKERKVDIAGGCPVCDRNDPEHPKYDPETVSPPGPRFVVGVIPFGEIVKGRRQMLPDAEQIPQATGTLAPSLWDALMTVFEKAPQISDPDKTSLIEVTNNGKVEGSTPYYSAAIDIPTISVPFRLSKPQRFALRKAFEPKGELDLIWNIARQIKSRKDIESILGGKTFTASDPTADGKPSCFGCDCDPADRECGACPHKVDCAKMCGVAVPGGSATLEPPPPSPAIRRPSPRPPEPEPEEEQEVAEVEEAPPPPPSSSPSAR